MSNHTDNIPEDEIAGLIGRATGLALQGDCAAAVGELSRLPDSLGNSDDDTFKKCMIDRFTSDPALPSDFAEQDVWVVELATLYVTYWHRVLTKSQSLEAAESELESAVRAFTGAASDDLEAEIQAEMTRRGFYVLLGRTSPLLELMIWKKQVTSEIDVELPEGTHPMTVISLDDFVLRGWGHYSTCGRRATGGWATDAGLFAVAPAYKRLDDEAFKVNFLAHEAQHSVDMQTYGTLESWELEYRAKLTELALAHTTQAKILMHFCENRNNASKQAPHSYANDLVLRNLEQRLNGQSITLDLCAHAEGDEQFIRDAAKALLIEDTRARSASGG